MGIKRLQKAWVALSVLFCASNTFAFGVIDESATWANVAQGHHQYGSPDPLACAGITDPQLTLYNSAKINGVVGGVLSFCSLNSSSIPSDSCNDSLGVNGTCTVTGIDLIGLDLTGDNAFKTSSGVGGSIGYCNTNDSFTLGEDGNSQFNSVSLYSACTLTMSTSLSEYRFTSIAIGSGATLVLSEGDYFIESLTLNSNSNVVLNGDVRIFVKNDINLNSTTVNAAALFDLKIIGYNNINLTGTSDVTANIYSNERLKLNGSSAIKGRVSSRYLEMNTTSSVTDTTPTETEFHIQYGKATATSITFDSAFPDDVTPLIFLMPTIEDDNSDGPASVFLTSVSAQGFTWSQNEPTSTNNRYVASENMPEVHWIAVTAGTYDLTDDITLIAGSVDYDQAIFGNSDPYTPVTLPSTQNVVLNQIQTQNNDCWFTSTSETTSTGIQLGLDTSEVYNRSNNQCLPGDLNNNQIVNETIGYLSLTAASGTMILNGVDTNYHFGQAQTFTASGTKDIEYQCGITTTLEGFTDTPTLVAGKNSRLGGDGGWLRRCKLTNDTVSMVVDEDTYKDNDRNHRWENYSFVAFESIESPVFQCFTDNFDRTDLGDDWIVSNSRGGFTPSIVSNRLQVTQAATSQATSSTYQRLFPAADNFVTIEFDHYAYGGSGADGIAFVLSDSTITPQAGAYGGPLGYGARSNQDGFAGGWLGFGIDEFGNFSREGGSGGPGRRQQSVAIRGSGSGTTGYPYLHGSCNDGTTNTGSCLSPTVDDNNTSPAHRYRITVDSQVASQSLVKVERDTGDGFVEIISEFDAASFDSQAALPENFLLSLTGSTGGSTNIHEIDNVEICALNSSPIGVQIDHFEYSYSGGGLTCTPKTLSIKACANAECTETVDDYVTATLTPASVTNGGWVGGNVVKFSGGEKADLQLRHNTVGTVTLGVSGSTPSTKAFSETLCRINGSSATAANCDLAFADSGFIFDVPDKLANKTTGNISISAVKTSDETLQCVPTFADTSKDVSFWSTYLEPTTPINGQSVTVNDTTVGKQSSTGTTIALDFDSTGTANIDVNYPDAGNMQLDVQYTGTDDEAGLVMLGSDSFVSFPVGLCITPKDSVAECSAGNSDCDVYKKAGETFDLIIQGKAWQSDADTDYCDNINTPNYAHDDIVLGHQLVAPSGGVLGEVGNTEYDHVAQTTNSNTVTQSVTEVGVFKFTANPVSTYLGSSFYDIPLAESVNIGRFVPDSFAVTSSSVLPSCGTFTYMDQPFDLILTLTAYNIAANITQNYQGAFAKATASLVGENLNDGVDLSSRLSTLPIDASSWSLGEASVGLTYQANLSRTLAPGVDGPFGQLDIGVQVADNDTDISFVNAPDMRADSSAICADNGTCNAKQISTQDFRHGRIVMDNTFGPETEILRMPTYAQYWNGTGWIINTSDSCSQVIDPLDGTEVYDPVLASNQTVIRSDGGSTVSAGQLTLLWQNTGSDAYRGQVTAPLQVDDWLKWYWNWDDTSPSVLYDPRASAFFGRYRGHDRIIYWREVGQ
ncbi:DUF6701 domain-containing protein [Shewanella saliphila]|uniref:DUF6701 domain-containing protein n=1 Tax=Shewanella saliphila TaxID=2282698 RepID=A0ABQ2Q3K0_9GAMM|nr:DUF6701 domain-containing protein [Shewanella saliphila]MCL1100678.1 MSHA biogenesis protein MshQ [Shewanella saliphila]GGP41637.1 hypothetical protein GCM10009409_05630 [Shewanella saliphila]